MFSPCSTGKTESEMVTNLQKMRVSTAFKDSPRLCNVPLQVPHPALQPLWNVAALMEIVEYLQAETVAFDLPLFLSLVHLCHLYILTCIIHMCLSRPVSTCLEYCHSCVSGFNSLLTFWDMESKSRQVSFAFLLLWDFLFLFGYLQSTDFQLVLLYIPFNNLTDKYCRSRKQRNLVYFI